MSNKIKFRMNPEEAKFLGIKGKPNEKGRNTSKYTVTQEQKEEVLKFRVTPNKRKFVEVIKKLDKDGEIVSTTEKLQSKPIDVPDNFEVIKISAQIPYL